MNRFQQSLIRVAASLGVLLSLLSPTQGTEQPKSQLTFSVYALRPIEGLYYGIYDKSHQLIGSTPIQFRSGGRSRDYPYTGPPELLFFTEVPAPTLKNPFAVRQAIQARVRLPTATTQQALCFFQPNPEEAIQMGADPYTLLLINDDKEALPWGSIVLVNTTHRIFKGKVGNFSDEILDIKPGQNPPVPLTPKGSVQLAAQFHNSFWQPVYSEQFTCTANERLILLLFPPRSQGGRQLRGNLVKGYRPP